MTKSIVTKTGNSYALRVPKRFIDENNLKLGDVVDVPGPLTKQRQAIKALIEHGKKYGPIKEMPDPVEWQRAQRAEWEERIKKNDITRQ